MLIHADTLSFPECPSDRWQHGAAYSVPCTHRQTLDPISNVAVFPYISTILRKLHVDGCFFRSDASPHRAPFTSAVALPSDKKNLRSTNRFLRVFASTTIECDQIKAIIQFEAHKANGIDQGSRQRPPNLLHSNRYGTTTAASLQNNISATRAYVRTSRVRSCHVMNEI